MSLNAEIWIQEIRNAGEHIEIKGTISKGHCNNGKDIAIKNYQIKEIETGIIHLNNLPADVESYVNRKANQANQTSEEWVTDLLIEKMNEEE